MNNPPALTFVAPGPWSTSAFVLIVLFVLTAFVAGVYRAYRITGGPALRRALYAAWGILLWLAVTSLMVKSGIVEAEPMPRLMGFFLLINLAALLVAVSPLGKRLAVGLPVAALVAFQGFRLPLEMVLHAWAAQGSIPVTMSWSGANPDIAAGTLALLVAPLVPKFPKAAWLANAVGFALLLNVAHTALMSSPLPFAWKVDPPLLLAFHLPYAWIATVCVPAALLGHIVLTRALLSKEA